MAIQMRRGVFDRFDPSRLLPGEFAVVLSGDEAAANGKALYVCFGSGDVKRVATWHDAVEIIQNAIPDIIEDMSEGVSQATQGANAAASNANDMAAAAEAVIGTMVIRQAANDRAQAANNDAQAANNDAQAANDLAQVANDTQQALNNEMASRTAVRYCQPGEYDPGGLAPTLADAQVGVLYLVPTGDAANPYLAWLWDGTGYAPVGGGRIWIGHHLVGATGYISVIEEG